MSRLLKLKGAVRTSQPQYPAGIATSGLGANVVLLQSSNSFYTRNAVPLTNIAGNSPALYSTATRGVGLKFDGSSYARVVNSVGLTYPLTLFCITDPLSTASGKWAMGLGLESDGFAAITIGHAGNWRVFERNTNLSVDSGVSVSSGRSDFILATIDASKVARIYVNGVYKAQGTFSGIKTGQTDFVVGGYPWSLSSDRWAGVITESGIINKCLTDTEVLLLYQYYYSQIFQPQTRNIWVPSAGGGATGTLATTNANDTSAASGSTTVIGALAKSNVDDTSAASGTTTVSGTLATTNASDTSNASGSVGNDITGTVATTNANDTSAAAGTTTVTGSLAKSNIDDTSAASGTTTVLGAVAYTNINDSVSASGFTSSITGTVDYTNNNDTSASSGTGSPNTQSSGGYLVETLAEKRRLTRRIEEAREVVQRIKAPVVTQDDAETLQEDAAEISRQLKSSIAELEAVAENYQAQLDQQASFKAFSAQQDAKDQARQIQALMIDAQLHAELAQQQIEELDVVFMAFALMAYV